MLASIGSGIQLTVRIRYFHDAPNAALQLLRQAGRRHGSSHENANRRSTGKNGVVLFTLVLIVLGAGLTAFVGFAITVDTLNNVHVEQWRRATGLWLGRFLFRFAPFVLIGIPYVLFEQWQTLWGWVACVALLPLFYFAIRRPSTYIDRLHAAAAERDEMLKRRSAVV